MKKGIGNSGLNVRRTKMINSAQLFQQKLYWGSIIVIDVPVAWEQIPSA